MKIEYEESGGMWRAYTTLMDEEGDGVWMYMYLDGAGGYNIKIDTSDLKYIIMHETLLEQLNAFVSNAKKRLEILEPEEEMEW
jgi:hypothetical protein